MDSTDENLYWGYSGHNGEKGEDCGIVTINDSITVYAYGGNAGGHGGKGLSSTGGGRKWISSCWNWRWSELGRWSVEIMQMEVGGFSGGAGEGNPNAIGINGAGGCRWWPEVDIFWSLTRKKILVLKSGT